MSFPRRFLSVLLASALALLAGRIGAAGGANVGAFTGRPPPPPDPDSVELDGFRKPPVPVSFLSHDGGWVLFQYPPSARDRVAPLIAQADDLRAELAEALGQMPLDGVEIRVARGHEEMVTLAPSTSMPLPEASGTTYPNLELIVLSLGAAGTSDPIDLADAFQRELARLALDEAVGGAKLPAWLSHGFSVHYSREGEWGREWSLYRAAVRRGTYPIASLDRFLDTGGAEGALALAEGVDFVGFLLKPEKHVRFAALIERLRRGEGFETALSSGFASDMPTLERDWRGELSRRTTLTSVLFGLGAPASLMLGLAVYRAARRRRLRLQILKHNEKKARGRAADSPRVHIVFNRRDERIEVPMLPEAEIPKVEHEGQWHTLH